MKQEDQKLSRDDQIKKLLQVLDPSINAPDFVRSDFRFECPSRQCLNWSYDIPYTLTVGSFVYSQSLGDWTTDLDRLRFELETYAMTGKTKIHFPNDTEEVATIALRDFNALSNKIEIGSGVVFQYEKITEVKVTPQDENPGCVAYCNGKEVLRGLYTGLLNVARMGFKYSETDENENDWDCAPLTFYNKIKSLIIEDFLLDKKYEENELQKRQVIVKDVFTISPDAACAMYHNLESVYSGPNPDDGIEFYDHASQLICKAIVPGVYDWQQDFERNTDFVDSHISPDFNLRSWHLKGLEIARQIKQQLPPDYDLWYEAPFEDTERRDEQPTMIMN